MSRLSLPLPGRFRNSQNHLLTHAPSARPELAQLKPKTQTAEAALLLVSRRFEDRRGVPYDALIDTRAFALLLKLASREGLIEYGPHGHPIDATRFLEELAPFARYFATGRQDPLPLFREGLSFWRAQAERDPADRFDLLPSHPHG